MYRLRIFSFSSALFSLIVLLTGRPTLGQAQARLPLADPFLENLLRSHASPLLARILDHPDSFRYQLIYTRIDRDKNNQPHFQNFFYRVDREDYFNPASTVKMPLSFLALEKMNDLAAYGVNPNTTMLIDSGYSGQSAALTDSTAASGLPSLAQYIKKIFLVSDNDAYNRLYEFLGQKYLNERLWQMGYRDIRITRRFVPMNEDENRHTGPVRFVKDGKLLYRQKPALSDIRFDFSHTVLIGNAHYDRYDSLIHQPMDFTRHNNVPLQDLQHILQSVLFPSSVPPAQRFRLTPANYQFLYRYMSQYPSEELHPKYDTSEYFDSYTKFFLFKAGKTPIPPYIRIFNKPGWSYGFLTDVAYIVDFAHKVEFMLTGVIYVNSDGVLNDDKYEYEELGYPFFKEVGNIVYQYELKRKKAYLPNLRQFKLSYNKGDF